MATVLVLLTLLMIPISGCAQTKIILLDSSQLYPMTDPNGLDGWFIENRAFKRLFQEMRVER